MKTLKYLIIIQIIALISCQNDRNDSITKEVSKSQSNSTSDTLFISTLKKNPIKEIKVDTSSFTLQNYGIGKVILNYESYMYARKEFTIRFLDSIDSQSSKEVLIIKWIEDKGGYVEVAQNDFLSIRDYYFEEPYYKIQFDCIKEVDGYYEVIVNESQKRRMWIKASSDITFITWEEFLKGVVCVSNYDTIANPVRIEPNEDSEICFSGDWCWDIVNIQGFWAQVMYSSIDEDLTDEYNREFRGWIKWRDKEKLLVKYFQAI